MKKQIHSYTSRNHFLAAGFLLSALLLLTCFFAGAQESSLTVITNTNGAPADLKLSELKSILKGERQRWRSGTKIIIALMKTNTNPGKSTCRKIYDMSADELNKFWLALVFQGKAQAPDFFNSAAELENFVAQNPGAIGITDQHPPSSDIKIITIDGQKSL